MLNVDQIIQISTTFQKFEDTSNVVCILHEISSYALWILNTVFYIVGSKIVFGRL